MANARDIIRGALQRLGKLSPTEDLKAEDADTCLTALNDMMRGWAVRGMTLYTHTDLALSTIFPMAGYEDEAKAILAVRMSDDFAPEAVTPELRRDARRGYNRIYGAYMGTNTATFDTPSRLY